MARLFLHFINRELHQSVGACPKAETYLAAIRLCSVLFAEPLVCNISQIYELLFEEREIIDELVLMSNAGLLQLDASHPTFDEFFEQRQDYYAHDLKRYPMYMNKSSGDIFARATISNLPLSRSTTSHIEGELLSIVSDASAAPRGMTVPELDVLRGMRGSIRETLINRENAGLTFALFPARKVAIGSCRQAYALRRALSGAYVAHYTEQLEARIVTGLPQLFYYDQRSPDSSVETDFRFMASLSRITGIVAYLDGHSRWNLTQRVESWNSSPHQFFAGRYKRLASGLDAAYRAGGSATPKVLWAIAQCRRVMQQQAHPASVSLEDVLLRCAASIASAVNLLRQQLSGFEKGSQMVKANDASRVLVTTAVDIEDKMFDLAVAREGLKQVGSDNGATESIQEYFGIPGVQLFQVRSSAGAIGPSGATLVSAAAIQRKDPHFVICCGICFGMNRDKQQLGDVIVSDQVAIYEPGKVQEKPAQPEFIPRGGKLYAGATLLNRARLVKRNWPEGRSHIGLLASGEKLVDSAPFKEYLRAVVPEAIGGEMESAGVFSATDRLKKEGIVIKGICDWGEQKDKTAQQLAAENAFSFAIQLIKKL